MRFEQSSQPYCRNFTCISTIRLKVYKLNRLIDRKEHESEKWKTSVILNPSIEIPNQVYVAGKAKITLSQTTTPPPPLPPPKNTLSLFLFFTNLTLQCCTCRLEKEVIERDRGWREAYIRQYPTQWSLILVSALGVGGKCFTCVKSWGRLGYLTGLVGAVHFFSFGRTGVMETVPCSMWISSSLGGLVFGL